MLITIVLVTWIFGERIACSQTTELGILSSPKTAGISLLLETKSGTATLVRPCFDLEGIPRGRYDKPGYKADCHLLFTAREFNFGKSALSLTGGPGAVVGYTHNTKGKYGVIAGVSGTFQATLRSGSPLSLSLGFTAMLGCHMSSNPVHGSTLEFHSLGVRYAYIPEITIRYRFL